MTDLLHYRIVHEPFANQKLSLLHWECFQAIKEGKLSELFDAQEQVEGKIFMIKALTELQSLDLIAPDSERLSYTDWVLKHGPGENYIREQEAANQPPPKKNKKTKKVIPSTPAPLRPDPDMEFTAPTEETSSFRPTTLDDLRDHERKVTGAVTQQVPTPPTPPISQVPPPAGTVPLPTAAPQVAPPLGKISPHTGQVRPPVKMTAPVEISAPADLTPTQVPNQTVVVTPTPLPETPPEAAEESIDVKETSRHQEKERTVVELEF